MSIADDRRFHRPDTQNYALQQARDRSTEALYRRGEYAMFVLMWNVSDFEAGRVGRCERCVTVYGDDVARAFGGQTAEEKCIDCFGTGFEGGFKAKIVRPSLWSFTASEDEQHQRRGSVERASASVQSTFDFTMDTGDYILRGDGRRWFVRAPNTTPMTTGFGVLTDAGSSLAYNYRQVDEEPITSVAFLIPPNTADLKTLLNVSGHGMEDFSDAEEIKPGAVLNDA